MPNWKSSRCESSHSLWLERFSGGVTYTQNMHLNAAHCENDSVLSTKKLAQFLFEKSVFQRERAPERKSFQALDRFQQVAMPVHSAVRRTACLPTIGLINVTLSAWKDNDLVNHRCAGILYFFRIFSRNSLAGTPLPSLASAKPC